MTQTRSTFSKSERLVSAERLNRLYNNGNTLKEFPLKLVYLSDEEAKPAQIAFSVPKRLFRKATDRNLLKRRMRESYRRLKSELYNVLIERESQMSLLLIYVGKEVAEYKVIDEKMNQLIHKLINDIKETNK